MKETGRRPYVIHEYDLDHAINEAIEDLDEQLEGLNTCGVREMERAIIKQMICHLTEKL